MATFLTKVLDAAEDALANDSTFRTWCGAIDAADAKDNYIFSDDSVDGPDDMPEKYVTLSEVEGWGYDRYGEGSGAGNFILSNGYVNLTFFESLAATVSWSTAARKAFKDFVFGQVQPFINAYEADGFRLVRISKIPFDEEHGQLRIIFDESGRKGYMYPIRLEVGTR